MIERWAALLALMALCGCQDAGTSPSFGIRVFHLTGTGPQAGLPEATDTLEVIITDSEGNEQSFVRTFASLSDLDGDDPMDKELAVPISPNEKTSIEVVAKAAETELATARVDGIVVESGGRRYVELMFTASRELSTLPSSLPSGRFGHAAARIESDGRVLITGGFAVAAASPCPAELATSQVCFELGATAEALLLDPSSGSIHATKVPMLRARALHQATALGDGRVVVSGGVSGATLGLERVDGVAGNFEYRMHFRAAPQDLTDTARSFEIFDPLLNREEFDVGEDGDVTSGGFTGAPGEPSVPGYMNTARFLHSAAKVPGAEEVLVVGGHGESAAPLTAELFRADRPGGAGFVQPLHYFSDSTLERWWPGAVATTSQILVVGGASPLSSASALIDRWDPSPSAFSDLSSCVGWDGVDRPGYSLVGPSAVRLEGAPERVLVTGWQGPLCLEPAEGLPATTEHPDGTVACAQTTYRGRAFFFDTARCAFSSALEFGEPHFVAGTAPLPSGGVLVAGGFNNGRLGVTGSAEILAAADDEASVLELESPRAFLTATPLFGGRVVLAGGMSFAYGANDDFPESISLSDVLEIYDPGYY